jgi:osmotically-inducible protein OsmY
LWRSLDSDARIQQAVLQELWWSTRIVGTKIGVAVEQGVVTLLGMVDGFTDRWFAQEAAHSIAGVLGVANELQVRTSVGGQPANTEIAQETRRALELRLPGASDKLRVTVSAGWVTLEGCVDSTQEYEEADKAGMDQKTARKWRRGGQTPSQTKEPRGYRTRTDVFAEVWSEIEQLLEGDAALEARTIFDHLCRQHPEKFQQGQPRTLQRRVKVWRALRGQPREVFFPQEHIAGRQAQSDFTYLDELGVTIAGQAFKHLFYHFTLTYSNREWGMVCASESWESLAEGMQDALWELGGVPEEHRTDSLTAAVKPVGGRARIHRTLPGLAAALRDEGEPHHAGARA